MEPDKKRENINYIKKPLSMGRIKADR